MPDQPRNAEDTLVELVAGGVEYATKRLPRSNVEVLEGQLAEYGRWGWWLVTIVDVRAADGVTADWLLIFQRRATTNGVADG